MTSSSIMRLERKVASRVSQSSKWYCIDYLQNSIMLKTDKLVGCQQPLHDSWKHLCTGFACTSLTHTAPHRTSSTSSQEAVPVPSVMPRIWIVYQDLSGKETLETPFRPHYQTAPSRIVVRGLMYHPDNLLAVSFAESTRHFICNNAEGWRAEDSFVKNQSQLLSKLGRMTCSSHTIHWTNIAPVRETDAGNGRVFCVVRRFGVGGKPHTMPSKLLIDK